MGMLPRNVLYYGSDEPLPEQIELRAGPLMMVFEDGGLRFIKLGEREILRGIYVAIRDRIWGTVLPILSNVQMDVDDDAFRVSFDVQNKEGDIDFFWQGAITGDHQGTVTFAMDGMARSTFLRSRIGFCVLHPIKECIGQPCTVEKVDGRFEEGVFPRAISPNQPFSDMRAISHPIVPGLRAEVRFDGEVFEMEDQRNWTDASYKSYCTPLALPFPVEVQKGTKVWQSVRLTLKGEVPELQAEPENTSLSFSLGKESIGPLPRIGLGIASHGRPLGRRELERLKALKLSHLRVDLKLFQPGLELALRQATDEANALGVSLEVALHLSDSADSELKSLIEQLKQVKPAVCTWLVFHVAEKSTSKQWIQLAREFLASYDPTTKIGSGTDVYFAELNRGRPPVEVLDVASYSLNPQSHAFDNNSLVETLEIQASTVENARQFLGTVPIAISPITLKARFKPRASGAEPKSEPGKLPSTVDARQMSLLGAGWTVGSLKYVSESGVESVTYYETSGWRGVMETEEGSPLPETFHSLPGSIFPIYHVLADVGEFIDGEIIPTTSNDVLKVDGLAMRKDDTTRLILANLSPEQQQVSVPGLNQPVRVRQLNETNAEEAMRSPEAFRAGEGETMQPSRGTLQLSLLPYAIARIDLPS
jgi:hypothetical protein